MDTGGDLVSITGVGLVLLTLAVVLATLYLLVLYWRSRTARGLKPLLSALNDLQREQRALLSRLEAYSAEGREPYLSVVGHIQRQLAEAGGEIAAGYERYAWMRARQRRMSFGVLQTLVSAPFYWFNWYRLRRDVSALRAGVAALQDRLALIRQETLGLEEQAWQVALFARATVGVAREIQPLLADLEAQKLAGDTFEAAASRARALMAQLEEIPSIFLAADKGTVLARSDQAATADVYDLVTQVRGELENLGEQLKIWKEEYGRTEQAVKRAQDSLDAAGELFSRLPPGLRVEAETNQLRSMYSVSEALNATLKRLEVESIPAVRAEAERLEKSGNDLRAELKQARLYFGALEPNIQALERARARLSEQFLALAQHPQFPIQFEASRRLFVDINRDIASLENPAAGLTPAQVAGQRSVIQAVKPQLKKLEEHLSTLAKDHDTLLALYKQPEIQDGQALLQQGAKIASQAAFYAPENWPPTDAVAELPGDIDRLAFAHQKMMSSAAQKAMAEGDLQYRLEDMQALSASLKAMQSRLEQVAARLEEIKNQEQEARELLQSTQATFNQIVWLVGSNAYLQSIAEKESGRFQTALKAQQAALGEPHKGTVAGKARRLSALVSQIEVAANRWLEKLNQEIERQKDKMAGKLDRLDELATLEDPAVGKIAMLLEQDLKVSVAGNGEASLEFALGEIAPILKARAEYWQECQAVLRAVEELVESPLWDSYERAHAARQNAREQLSRVEVLTPGERAWPPTSQSSRDVRREIAELEKRWQAIQSQPTRAIWAVRKYSELASDYRGIAERLRQIAQYAEMEQQKIMEVEGEIARLLSKWREKERAYQAEPQALRQIRNLRALANQQLEETRQQWLLAGRPGTSPETYDQVYQRLLFLSQELKQARIRWEDGSPGGREVSLDDEHDG